MGYLKALDIFDRADRIKMMKAHIAVLRQVLPILEWHGRRKGQRGKLVDVHLITVNDYGKPILYRLSLLSDKGETLFLHRHVIKDGYVVSSEMENESIQIEADYACIGDPGYLFWAIKDNDPDWMFMAAQEIARGNVCKIAYENVANKIIPYRVLEMLED